MQINKFVLTGFCVTSLGISVLQAQEATVSAGGSATGAGGSVSYSVGQVVYTSGKGSNGNVIQGVQQPYEISVVIGVEKAIDISLNISAYPNPATDYLVLKVEDSGIVNLSYKLFDSGGKLLADKNIQSTETSIDMSSLIPATYLLKVMQEGNEVKTFKIIKN